MEKEFHAFPKRICSKLNAITQLEFEFVYYDVPVQCVNRYATWT